MNGDFFLYLEYSMSSFLRKADGNPLDWFHSVLGHNLWPEKQYLVVFSPALTHACFITDAAMYNNSGALPTSPVAPTTYGMCDI